MITELLLATSMLVAGQIAGGVIDPVRGPMQAAGEIAPARLVSGALPAIPAGMVAGGQVFLELTIDVDGRVAGVRPLRATPPLTAVVTDAVKPWRFEASQKTVEKTTDSIRFAFKTPRVSKVFVGAVFRPPSIMGPTIGTPPVDAEVPDLETPYPVATATPPFPIRALGAGVVLVEIYVEADGSVSDACVIESAPPFDPLALDAARRFRFRPARVEGTPVASYAYILFGFPLPMTHERPQ